MDDAAQYITAFRALSDKNRMSIVKLLAGGELCGCQINEYFKISQPTLSHHMKILCGSGLLLTRKEATMIHYRINKEMMSRLSGCFNRLAGTKEGRNDTLSMVCCEDAISREIQPENEIKDGDDPVRRL